MKIELDVNEKQLQELDKGLTSLLTSLTKKQQTELIQQYMMQQMDKLYIQEEGNYWQPNKQELTAFGKKLQDSLVQNMGAVMHTEILKHTNTQKIMDEVITHIENNLYQIIQTAITNYIIEHLFSDKNNIESKIQEQIGIAINQLYSDGRIR